MRKYLQIHNPSPDDVAVQSFETEKHGTKWSVRLGPADDSVTFYGTRTELIETFTKVMKGLGYGVFQTPFVDEALRRAGESDHHFDHTVTDNMSGEVTMYPAWTKPEPEIEPGQVITISGVPVKVDDLVLHPGGGYVVKGRVIHEPTEADTEEDRARVTPTLDFEEARRARREALGLPELGDEWDQPS